MFMKTFGPKRVVCPCPGTIDVYAYDHYFSNIFSSKTNWPIKANLFVEPPWVGGTKICFTHLGRMTKMAAESIYGKSLSKNFFGTSGLISTRLGIKHRGPRPIIVCSNDDLR